MRVVVTTLIGDSYDDQRYDTNTCAYVNVTEVRHVLSTYSKENGHDGPWLQLMDEDHVVLLVRAEDLMRVEVQL